MTQSQSRNNEQRRRRAVKGVEDANFHFLPWQFLAEAGFDRFPRRPEFRIDIFGSSRGRKRFCLFPTHGKPLSIQTQRGKHGQYLEDYLERSWCLFEIMVNKFNRGNPILPLGYGANPTLEWMEKARLVQQCGFVQVFDPRLLEIRPGLSLELPKDRLHLKSQLRKLFLASNLTNQGDIRVVLNLLDKLV